MVLALGVNLDCNSGILSGELGILVTMKDVTQILSQIESGDPSAADQLLPLVYNELRKLAAQKMAQENPGQTLQATALVHEAYLRLVGSETRRTYRDRHHFFASAATAMRRILVDYARAKRKQKRGGSLQREPLQDVAAPMPDDELLALHEALDKLGEVDPLKTQLVELRYFEGLTGEQDADALLRAGRPDCRLLCPVRHARTSRKRMTHRAIFYRSPTISKSSTLTTECGPRPAGLRFSWLP